MIRAGGIVAALAALPAGAAAHAGGPVAPHDVPGAWNADPLVLVGLTATAWLYGRGLAALWERAGVGRGVAHWRAGAFAAGIAALAVALVSPLDRLGETLFSAHMVQHLLLVLVAAPLLVLGRPVAPLAWALPPDWRRSLGRWRHGRGVRVAAAIATAPVVAWMAHAAAIWLWHVPALYEGALAHPALHAAEHAAFLGTAILFWWTMAQAGPRRRLGFGTAVVAVFAMGVQGAVLGALIALAPTAWYPSHGPGAAAWGMTPLEDQQLAGLIMWVPASLAYLLAGLVLFAAWMRTAERRTRGRARALAPMTAPAD